MDWNNESKVRSGCEANPRNLVSACFNINRKDLAATNEPSDKDADVRKRWLRPDRALWSPDIGEVLFFYDLRKIGYGCGSEFPLPGDSRRMISTQQLITTDSMSANTSSTTEFRDASSASHCPKSRIAKTDDKIRIMGQDLITQAIKFILELLPDILGFLQKGKAGNALGLAATEVEKVIPGWVLLEDVSSVQLRMQVPYRSECPRVPSTVEFLDVRAIFGGEGDDSCVIQHTQEFRACGTDEAATDLSLVITLGFADEEDWFHRSGAFFTGHASDRTKCSLMAVMILGSPLSV